MPAKGIGLRPAKGPGVPAKGIGPPVKGPGVPAKGDEAEPMAWKGFKGEEIWKNKNEEGRNINKKEVPKFALRILQASHFGARNKCLQTAKMF